MSKTIDLALDCEFNGFNGELISMALVACDFTIRREVPSINFYQVIDFSGIKLDKWVEENVIPILWLNLAGLYDCPEFISVKKEESVSREEFQSKLAKYIDNALSLCDAIRVHCDWPDDIRYFCESLITGPGKAIAYPDKLSFVIHKIDAASDCPHNALQDARGIANALINKGRVSLCDKPFLAKGGKLLKI